MKTLDQISNWSDQDQLSVLQILTLSGDPNTTQRLSELGFLEGANIRYLGQAPFSGPFIFQLGAGSVALRKEEAACIQVK